MWPSRLTGALLVRGGVDLYDDVLHASSRGREKHVMGSASGQEEPQLRV
jgi:hypothetical protein